MIVVSGEISPLFTHWWSAVGQVSFPVTDGTAAHRSGESGMCDHPVRMTTYIIKE